MAHPTDKPAVSGLIDQKTLQESLGISDYPIKDRIRRHPAGTPHAFPVDRIGRNRRFEFATVRAWFAWEAAGFPDDAIPAAVSTWYAAHAATPAA